MLPMLQCTEPAVSAIDSALIDVPGMMHAAVSNHLRQCHATMFGRRHGRYLNRAIEFAAVATREIGQSDALYHNVEHTTQVTLVGAAILVGRHNERADVSPQAWLDSIIAMLCHDIGYVRGICRDDRGEKCATGVGRNKVNIDSLASDAALMPYHVDRGKRFVAEYFAEDNLVDAGTVQTYIERTRFPVPADAGYSVADDFAGLVRAADLIGQLSDRRYLNKLSAVYYEFEETGFNGVAGYRKPGDLLKTYPEFFRARVQPYIGAASRYLRYSTAGSDVLWQLEENLARARGGRRR